MTDQFIEHPRTTVPWVALRRTVGSTKKCDYDRIVEISARTSASAFIPTFGTQTLAGLVALVSHNNDVHLEVIGRSSSLARPPLHEVAASSSSRSVMSKDTSGKD